MTSSRSYLLAGWLQSYRYHIYNDVYFTSLVRATGIIAVGSDPPIAIFGAASPMQHEHIIFDPEHPRIGLTRQ
jgi:hypothetical protein